MASAQVMANNYARACLSVQKGNEKNFRPTICSAFQARVWADFMQLQARCMMNLLNDGTGFLAKISRSDFGLSIITVVITDGHAPDGKLETLDFNAETGDLRRIFMVVEVPGGQLECSPSPTLKNTLHKLGTTLPISDDYNAIWESLPLQHFSIGGSQCEVCRSLNNDHKSVNHQPVAARKAAPRSNMKNLNSLLRRENLVNQNISNGLRHSRLLSKSSVYRRIILRRKKRFIIR